MVIGRSLADGGVNETAALGIRFAIGAALLALFQLARRGPLLPVAGERLPLFLLGAVGYSIESTFFYLGLQRGTAAAVGLVFYCYPAMVAIAEMLVGNLRPSASLLGAVALSATGVVFVIGAAGEVSITAAGILFALLAALSFTVYLLCSHRFVTRSDAVVNAMWVSGGAAVSMVTRGLITDVFSVPEGHAAALAGYGLANAVAFGMMFAALGLLGPTPTAVILNVEVLATVVLSAVFLDERLRPLQLVGGLAVGAGAVLAALAAVPSGEPPVDGTPP